MKFSNKEKLVKDLDIYISSLDNNKNKNIYLSLANLHQNLIDNKNIDKTILELYDFFINKNDSIGLQFCETILKNDHINTYQGINLITNPII